MFKAVRSIFWKFRKPAFYPFLLSIFLGVVFSQNLLAWSFHTHRKLASDALNRMPESFQKRFGQFKDDLLRGATDPDRVLKDFQNHVYHIRGSGHRLEATARMSEVFSLISEKIAKGAPDKEIAYWLGIISHYVADINVPLHTAGAESDPNEDEYHAAFEKEVENHLSIIPIATITIEPVTDPAMRLREMALAANAHYFEIGVAYRTGNRFFDVKDMVVKQYNSALKNIIDYWVGAFNQSGKKIESMPQIVFLVENLAPLKSASSSQPVGNDSFGKINLNSASVQELMTIPGVGEKKAKLILQARPFRSIYDLARVKGFGVKSVDRIGHLLTTENTKELGNVYGSSTPAIGKQ
ncbi:MAG: helix-hairpin-helix domain-containing protein [Candidatus Riflebacteria bacterium]|nr:helix-hairpin-helix domain-containing protein [Candidatus Riflebacteria bacterium]